MTVGDLIGREKELTLIRALASRSRVLIVTGPAGVGKSSLVAELQAPTAALDDANDRLGVCAAIGRAIGAPTNERTLDAIERGLCDVVATLPLLVLDGCDRASDHVSRLLERFLASTEARFVVTSRAPLRSRGAQKLTIGPLEDEDALSLFVSRAQLSDPTYRPERAAEIVRRLDGLPLAIELVAARLHVLGETEILARYPHALDIADRKGSTLRHALAFTWSLLERKEQEALRALSVFRGTFDLDACPNDEALEALCARSLVRAIPDTEPKRFRVLEHVRAFVAETIERKDKLRFEARHTRHYVKVARRSASSTSTTTALADDLPNLMIAYERSHDPDLVIAMAPVLFLHGPHLLLARLLSTTPKKMPRRSRSALHLASALLETQHDLRKAREHARRALTGADTGVEARARSILISIALRLCDRTEVKRQAAALARMQTRDSWQKGTILVTLATAALAVGDHERAIANLDAAEDAFRDIDVLRVAYVRLSRGWMHHDALRLDEAQAGFELARATFEEHKDRFRCAEIRGCLAGVAWERGDLALAETLYRASHTELGQIGARALEALQRAAHGGVLAAQGRIDEAERTFVAIEGPVRAGGDRGHEGAVAAFRAQIDVARARASADDDAKFAHWERANKTLAAVAEACTISEDARFAARMLERALAASKPRPRLVIAKDGRWFRTAAKKTPLESPSARRILGALVRARTALGTHELVAAGWPDERVLAEAGAVRVRVALASLRKLGLRDFITRADDGWRIDPSVEVRINGD